MDISFDLRKIRKSIAGLSILAVLTSLVSFAGFASAAFSDVPSSHYASDAIETASDAGWVNGYANGNFGPNDKMTRAQLAKVVSLAFDLDVSAAADFDSNFSDMPGGDLDAYVKTVAANGVMTGYADGSGKFGSNDSVERQDLAVVLYRLLGVTAKTSSPFGFDDVDSGTYYFDAVGTLWWWQVVNGLDNDTFGTGKDVIRADAVLMIVRSQGDLELRDPETVPSGDGELEVYLASSTPEETSVPKNGFEVPYTTIVFDASDSDSDVEVTSITVSREGLGDHDNFDKVKLYVGRDQLGSERTISSETDTAEFNLSSDPLVVPEGSKVLVSIVGDMAGGSISGASNSLGIESEDDVEADASVSGDFPVFGEEMELANVEVGTLTVSQTDVTGDIDIGDTDEVLQRFSLEAGSEEDVSVERIRIKHVGSANGDDYANLELREAGVAVGEYEWDDDYLVFDFEEPIEIQDGEDLNFVLYGDVVGGVSSTSAFEIKETEDVIAFGGTHGFRVSVTAASFAPTSRSIEGGVLNVSLASDNPPTDEIGIGEEKVEFMRFNLTTGGDAVLITNFGLDLTPATAAATELNNVKIWRVTENGTLGAAVAGPVDPDEATVSTLDSLVFTDDWLVGAQGTETFAVTANVESSVSANDTFRFDIDVSDIEAEYDSDGDSVASADLPSSDVTGSVMTVSAPTLTVTAAAQPADQTIVKNAQDVEIVAFNLKANGVSDLTVTSVELDLNGSGTQDYNDVNNIQLYLDDDGVWTPAGGGSRNISSSTSAVVFSTNFSVEQDSSVRLLVVADIPSTAVAGHIFSLGFEAAGNFTVNDDEGSTSNVTVTLAAGNAADTTGDVEVTVASAGSLAAAIDGSTPSASVVSTDSAMVPVTTVNFSATNEDFEVTQFQVKVDDAADADEVESITVQYENEAGETITSTESLAGSTANFAGESLWVAKGGDADLWIFVNTAEEADGADSVTTLGVDLDYDTNFEAFGDASNSRVTSVGAADVAGNHHSVYASDLLVKVNSGTPTGDSTGAAGKDAFKFDLKSAGENTPSLMAVAVTVSGNATLGIASTGTISATGSALLKDGEGNTEATEAYVTATSDASTAASTSFGVAALSSINGIPRGATVLIWDDSADAFYARTTTVYTGTTVTFTPAITSYDDAATDTLTYLPLQPGAGKLYFGAASALGANLADTGTTVTVASTSGFSVNDTVTVRGTTTAGVVIACTGTISAIGSATAMTISAADCTSDGTIDYDYDTPNLGVAYTDLIDEEIAAAGETFTVNGDTTGAEPSSTGSRTIQLSLAAGSDIDWNDDWSDVGDDVDNGDENTSFLIQSTLLNVEKDGYSTFPLTGGALKFNTQLDLRLYKSFNESPPETGGF